MLMSGRMASPDRDVVGSANRLGIRLKCARYLRRSSTPRSGFGKRPPATPHGFPGAWDNNITEPNRRSTTPNGSRNAMYIHDVIVPLSTTSCEYQSRASPFPQLNIRSPTAVSFPQMRNCTTPRPPSNTVKTMSSIIDKYLISTTAREDTILLGESRKRWNSSGQAIRFEAEQEERLRCRSVKKNSQGQPHREDRLYYMCGTSVDIQERYYVDDEELQRVKDLSRARKKLTHYGKGLREPVLSNQDEENCNAGQSSPAEMEDQPTTGPIEQSSQKVEDEDPVVEQTDRSAEKGESKNVAEEQNDKSSDDSISIDTDTRLKCLKNENDDLNGLVNRDITTQAPDDVTVSMRHEFEQLELSKEQTGPQSNDATLVTTESTDNSHENENGTGSGPIQSGR